MVSVAVVMDGFGSGGGQRVDLLAAAEHLATEIGIGQQAGGLEPIAATEFVGHRTVEVFEGLLCAGATGAGGQADNGLANRFEIFSRLGNFLMVKMLAGADDALDQLGKFNGQLARLG